MSEPSVEVVRGLVAAWNDRDPQLAAGFLADDVEWAPAGPAAVERVVYRGREECAKGFASAWETWEEFRFEEGEVRDVGDSVLWLGQVHMKGGASHLELDQQFANLFLLSDGLIARSTAFLSWSEALQAAGLDG
ncbi:MAG: nuclear transport factor 2 family protein [Solirubrobacterales bacterium]